MWPNPHFPADLVAFTKDILNGKLHYLCYLQTVFWKCCGWVKQAIMLNQSFLGFKLLQYILPLTHFMPLISFDTPWKHQKIRGFMMFSGGIKRDQWHEMGWWSSKNIAKCDRKQCCSKIMAIVLRCQSFKVFISSIASSAKVSRQIIQELNVFCTRHAKHDVSFTDNGTVTRHYHWRYRFHLLEKNWKSSLIIL